MWFTNLVDASSWISVVSACLAALSLVVAIFSRRDSKRANRLSEAANETAREGLKIANEANALVEESNQLAENANLISQRALEATTDNLVYDWIVEIKDEELNGILINNSPHDAREVSVVVKCESKPVFRRRQESIPEFGDLILDLSSVFAEQFRKVRANPAVPAQTSGGIFFSGSPGKVVTTLLEFHVSWMTPTGIQRDAVVEQTLSHFDNYGSITRK